MPLKADNSQTICWLNRLLVQSHKVARRPERGSQECFLWTGGQFRARKRSFSFITDAWVAIRGNRVTGRQADVQIDLPSRIQFTSVVLTFMAFNLRRWHWPTNREWRLLHCLWCWLDLNPIPLLSFYQSSRKLILEALSQIELFFFWLEAREKTRPQFLFFRLLIAVSTLLSPLSSSIFLLSGAGIGSKE